MTQMKITPLKDQPRYIEAVRHINEMGEALAKVQGRIVEIEALLANADLDDTSTSHVAAALQFVKTGEVRGADNVPVALREEHVILREQREALQRAIRPLHDGLHYLDRELTAGVVRDATEAHREIAGRMLEALKALNDLQEEELRFVGAIEKQGYSPCFQTLVQWPVIGTLSQQSESSLWHRVRELQSYVNGRV